MAKKAKQQKSSLLEELYELGVKAGKNPEELREALYALATSPEERKKQIDAARKTGLKTLGAVEGIKATVNGANGKKTKVVKFTRNGKKLVIWAEGQMYPEAVIQKGAVGISFVKISVKDATLILEGAKLILKIKK